MIHQAMIHKGSHTTHVTLPHELVHGDVTARQACTYVSQIMQLLSLNYNVHLISQACRPQSTDHDTSSIYISAATVTWQAMAPCREAQQ